MFTIIAKFGKMSISFFGCKQQEFRAFQVFVFRSSKNLNTKKNVINYISCASHSEKKYGGYHVFKKSFMTLLKMVRRGRVGYYNGVL